MTDIYVDVDDVLSESYKTFLSVLDKEFGKKATYSQISTFSLQESFDLTDDEYAHFFDCIHEPEEIMCHEPVPGSQDLLKKWKTMGYTISILTGRPVETRDITLQWLEEQNYTYDSFSIVNKYGRQGSEDEQSLSLKDLSSLPFDLAIEDSGQMAKFLSETMDVTVALIDRPWNRDIDFNEKVHRCMDWDDVKAKFETLGIVKK
jgi:uncharacterized HAD superfamily protein